MPKPILLPLMMGLSAASTGYSVWQQNKAAKAAESQGLLEMQMGLQAASHQTQAAESQMAVQAALTAQRQAAAEATAANLRQQANVVGLTDLESQVRQRQADTAFRSSQEAAFSNSGLMTAGTPLQLMAETAGIQQLAIAETSRQAEVQRRQVLHEADKAQYGAVEAGMAGLDAQMQGVAALAQAGQTGYKAKLAGMEGKQRAGEMRANAWGTALQGVASLAGTAYQGFGGMGRTAGAGPVRGISQRPW